MTKDSDDEKCASCLATEVSFNVLHEFTDARPKVKMSYDDWMFLRYVIEEEIKEALGVPSEDGETEGEKPTVQ